MKKRCDTLFKTRRGSQAGRLTYVIVSGYVIFYQINKFSLIRYIIFFINDKIYSLAVVWRPLI